MFGGFKNKKGNVGIIIVFFLILFSILIIGFGLAILTGVFGFVGDTITPIMNEVATDSGVDTLNDSVNYTFGLGNSFVQSMPWIVGFGYVLALIFSIVFVAMYSYNPNPVFIGFYFMLVVLLFFGAVIMSNMYQDIYEGTDIISQGLQEQPLMSNMILYSPFYMVLIALIAGIFLFAKPSQDDYGGGI